MSKINIEEEKLQELREKFFNSPTLPSEEKTLKDFEKLQFQNNFNKLQKIIRRKKKSKNFDEVLKKYLEMQSMIGGR
jgi:hypothetical protein